MKLPYISKFLLVLTTLFLISYQIEAQSEKHHPIVDEIEISFPSGDFEPEEVKKHLSFLTKDELEGREIGSKGYKKAVDYVVEQFKIMGLKPYFDGYIDTFFVKGKETYNVVGFLPGQDRELSKQFVIVGAHLDHIGTTKEVNGDHIANGANDNASGSTAVLLLASHLAKMKMNARSVLFVLFGAEESGLKGSEHLAMVLKGQKIDLYTMLNFEMIGIPPVNDECKAYLTGYNMSNMAEKLNEYTNKGILGFLPKAKKANLFQRSDNYPFYNAFHVPCQTVFSFDFENFPFYHHVDDELSQIDLEYMTALINDLLPSLYRTVNSKTKEITLH